MISSPKGKEESFELDSKILIRVIFRERSQKSDLCGAVLSQELWEEGGRQNQCRRRHSSSRLKASVPTPADETRPTHTTSPIEQRKPFLS